MNGIMFGGEQAEEERSARPGARYLRNIPVKLSEMEQRVAKAIGKARLGEGNGATSQISKRDPLEVETNAVGAELAACKVLGIYPDLTVVTGSTPRPTHDAIWILGGTLDIKHQLPKPGGHNSLLVRKMKQQNGKVCRYYALVVGRLPNFKVVGWTYGDVAVAEENWNKDMPVPCYVMSAKKLFAFHELSVTEEFRDVMVSPESA